MQYIRFYLLRSLRKNNLMASSIFLIASIITVTASKSTPMALTVNLIALASLPASIIILTASKSLILVGWTVYSCHYPPLSANTMNMATSQSCMAIVGIAPIPPCQLG